MVYLSSLLCSCIVNGYVLFEIMESLYEKKFPENRWIYKVGLFVYIILSVLISGMKIPALNIIYSMLILCILSYMLYVPYNKNIFLNSMFVIIYFAIIDVIVTTIFSIFAKKSIHVALENSKLFFVSGVGNAILMLCTFHFLVKLIKHCHINKISKSLHLYMLFLAVFEFGILCNFLRLDFEVEHNISLLLICIGFIIVDGGALYLFKVVSRNAVLEKQADLIEQQRKMTIKYYEGLQERYTETQKLLHDMKKHLRVIENLEVKNVELKNKYATELIETLENIQQQFQCSDQIVCAILWEKIQICKREDIDLDINMQDVKFDFMDRIELTSLFANLLDNAIESFQESRRIKREINLRIHQFKDYIVIKMRNTLGNEPIARTQRLQSTKEGHLGMGMLILASLANKYCGNLNYDYTEDYFETKIILSINNHV